MLLEELVHERENGEKYVSAYDLHEWLEVKSRFNDWIKNRVKKYKFEENSDFRLVVQERATNNPKNPKTTYTDYEITLDMAKEICMMERRNEKAGSVLECLLKYDNKEAVVLTKHTYTRFELSFGKQLEEILRPLNIEIETQKPIFGGKYRIDFYLPEFNLAIEINSGRYPISFS